MSKTEKQLKDVMCKLTKLANRLEEAGMGDHAQKLDGAYMAVEDIQQSLRRL